jgi:hypothetical protein
MAKYRFSLLLLFFALALGISSGRSAVLGTNVFKNGQYSYQDAPTGETPFKLKDVWLRFHEDDLCQKVDAAFVFSGKRMDLWVNVNKKKNYRKLLQLLEPLQNSYKIEMHNVQLATQKEADDIKTPPPSFLVNSELITYFRDSFLRDTGVFNQELLPNSTMPAPSITYEQRFQVFDDDRFSTEQAPSEQAPSFMYEQRLLLFAKNTLAYNEKIKRYAADLPSLARVAFDPAEAPELRRRALVVCREHAQQLQKYEEKLINNLSITLPKASQKQHETNPLEKSVMTKTSASDIAVLLAGEAQGLSDRVYQFIYPQNHTVTVNDLRNSPLIQSLETIQKITAEFRDLIG